MINIPFLYDDSPFPNVEEALQEPNGLLAFGGSLSIDRLFTAYSNGIFPWFSDQEPILWWSPDPRAIIKLNQFHASRSLQKLVKKKPYVITLNRDFKRVIESCAQIPRHYSGIPNDDNGTWITREMQLAYCELHEAGLAHSVEIWENDDLVGGLYGIGIGKVFCGESMFHTQQNTSKLAMYALVTHMKSHNLSFIDCQLPTAHLRSLGAHTVSRNEFIAMLKDNNKTCDGEGHLLDTYQHVWRAQVLSV